MVCAPQDALCWGVICQAVACRKGSQVTRCCLRYESGCDKTLSCMLLRSSSLASSYKGLAGAAGQ